MTKPALSGSGAGDPAPTGRARWGVDHGSDPEEDPADAVADRPRRGPASAGDHTVPEASEPVKPDVARPRFRPVSWHRDHRIGVGGVGDAAVLCVIAGALGPSVVTIPLGPRRDALPPW